MNNQLEKKIPKHVGIIMDGNGRWAKQRGLPRIAGHKEGMQRAREIVEAAGKWGIKYLSLFAFSTENWKRPADEVKFLMNLLESAIENEFGTLMENNVKFLTSGRIQELPGNLGEKLQKLVAATTHNTGLVLNLAVNYGGRAEIVDATKKICQDVRAGLLDCSQLDEELFNNYLYNPELPPADLIIRPSGEMRISNFLLWQAAYAELVTVDTLWPSFTPADLEKALQEYAGRERRFGGIVS
ncbi:MAG: isoprenyl transferase [Firmicutes bacterium]|nr:isoprenyl transferase [Bacillota bacterium]